MHVKKHLGFNGLRKTLSGRFEEIADPRNGKVVYSLHDGLMSAFAMMFFQDPSLLAFQRRLQEATELNNLKTLFQVEDIPGDTQLRETIDAAEPKSIEAVFSDFFRSLQRGKHLETYRVLDGRYPVVIDGSEYFSSQKLHCPGCLFKTNSKGEVRYHHQILQAALVHPEKRQIIPLAPEPIGNEDGTEKQDCEINAAKRAVKKIRTAHPKLKIIIVGDGLFSKQPFIDALKESGMSYVLVAKPKDHKVLFEWVDELRGMNEVGRLEFTDRKNRIHRYQWAKGIPLNGTPKADAVNYFQYTLIPKGKPTYHNTWVTDLPVNEDNVAELVRVGRARWKIENEGFNTLKNQGYHIEHNFGHGKKNLSYNFFLLNLLAFLVHRILELTDVSYQTCRAKFSSRREYWNQLRCTLRIIVFKTWESFLSLIIDPEHWKPPP